MRAEGMVVGLAKDGLWNAFVLELGWRIEATDISLDAVFWVGLRKR